MLPTDETRRERLRRRLPSHVEPVALSHGTVVGDVTPHSAVVWTRTAEPATVHVDYSPTDRFERADRAEPRSTDPSTDHTVSIRLDDLEPQTTYTYRVWALAGRGSEEDIRPGDAATTGTFRTAPAPDADVPVSFTWTGDTYGQGRAPPYQVPDQMADHDPDFFLYLGDTIYADAETPAVPDGDPQTVADYRAKYKEIRERGRYLREFLRETSVVPIWDDHEVTNDWAGTAEPLLPPARQAFFEYWPVDQDPSVTGEDDGRLYRSFRWGSTLELFVLDARQYRDPNTKPDGPDKTMLGDEQRDWLKTGLAETDATFAIVASSISLTSPSSAPSARDSWASGGTETGFEHELQEVVDHVRRDVDSTVVWLAGDRHFARVASFDLDCDGSPDMYEAMAGPIGAAPREPGDPDRTLDPTVHYEEGGKYDLGEFYNFGTVEATPDHLRLGIVDKVGDRRCTVTIDADGEDPLSVDSVRPDAGQGALRDLVDLVTNPLQFIADRWR